MVNLHQLQILPLVLRWRHADDSSELAVEVGEIVKPYFKADLRNREIIINKELAGVTYFYFIEKLGVRFVGALFKIPTECRGAHMGNGRNLVQRRITDIMMDDVLVYIIHPFTFIFIHR